jgi:hypothetical protein
MCLLAYNNDGEFSLTKDFVGYDTPEYAMLSHRWEADTEEVTFKDLIDGTGKAFLASLMSLARFVQLLLVLLAVTSAVTCGCGAYLMTVTSGWTPIIKYL